GAVGRPGRRLRRRRLGDGRQARLAPPGRGGAHPRRPRCGAVAERGRRRYGYATTSTGVVVAFVGGPKSLTTWSIVPWFVIERLRMSCRRTPAVTGTSKALVTWIDGSTLKKQ